MQRDGGALRRSPLCLSSSRHSPVPCTSSRQALPSAGSSCGPSSGPLPAPVVQHRDPRRSSDHTPCHLHTGGCTYCPTPWQGATSLSPREPQTQRNQPWLLLSSLSSGMQVTNLMFSCFAGGADNPQPNNPQPTPPLHRASAAPLPCARDEKGLTIFTTSREMLMKCSLEPHAGLQECSLPASLGKQLSQLHVLLTLTYTPRGTHTSHPVFSASCAPHEQHHHKTVPIKICPGGSAHAEGMPAHIQPADTRQQGRRPLL